MFFIVSDFLHVLTNFSQIKYIVYILSPFIFITVLETFSLVILSFYIEKLKHTNKKLELSNATLSDMNDDIRAFRHDFNNIIQSIGGYIETNDLESLKIYYKDLVQDCQHTSNLECLNPEVINNSSIYALLVSKYYKAESKNISLQFDINIDLGNLHISNYELSRILGILLDNSIEAADECPNRLIHFRCSNDSNNNRDLIIIENTYLNKDIDTIKIFEKSYSTKENNTGLGLWEVNRILNKHKNLSLFTNKNNNFFVQQLEIYRN